MLFRSRLAVMILLSAFVVSGQRTAAPIVAAVHIDSIIHPVTVELVRDAIAQATAEHAEMLIIKLNTPGGLLDATRDVIHEMLAAPIPVITYVTPSSARAASAGFFILEAGDLAAMAPGTNTGAASPVLMGQQMDPVMRKKVENDAAALLRSLTSRRGRNSELAESTIRDAKSFTEKEALNGHLIDFIAANDDDLLRQLNDRQVAVWNGATVTLNTTGAIVSEVHESWRERLIGAIADPNIAFVLLIAGILGLYVEFSAPGHIVPGIAGAIAVLLALSSMSVLPINWTGVLLLVLAVSMFVLEAKFASHGALAVGGTIALILGAVLLVNGPPEVRIHLSTAIGVAVPFALITAFLVSLAVRARRNKRMLGLEGMLDEVGIARTALQPEGQVLVRGEYWDAVSSAPVQPGTPVRITGVQGLQLTVEPSPKGK